MGNSATNPATSNTPVSPIDVLRAKLSGAMAKKQIEILAELAQMGNEGVVVIKDFLLAQAKASPIAPSLQQLVVRGKAYQLLLAHALPECQAFLQTHFPEGVVPLISEIGIDYAPLQKLLAKQDFFNADKLTLQKLCELAGTAAVQRKWVYFTEVKSFPVADLQTINQLWVAHSEGKFGFSVQRELWLSLGKNWEKLWAKIHWKEGNLWTRYPNGFTWSMEAPLGHLPLSNQLRGVRVIEALLEHPAWEQTTGGE